MPLNNNHNNKITIMKKSIFAIFACLVLCVSCKSDDPVPTMGLEQANYVLPSSGSFEIRLVSSQPLTAATNVAITTTGSAVLDKDFTLSKASFEFAAGESVAKINVTSKTYASGKSFTLALGTLPAGFQYATISSSKITVTPKDILIFTFESRNGILSLSSDFNVSLSGMDGKAYVAPEDIHIPLMVDAKSTAVEGTHFSFAAAKEVVIPKGKSVGAVKLNWIKTEAEKNMIVLKSAATEGYVDGSYPSISISVAGAAIDKIMGTWSFLEVSNKSWWESAWGEDVSKFPTGTTADELTFTNSQLITNIAGSLKNYFAGTSDYEFVGERKERIQEAGGLKPPTVTLEILKIVKINVNFDSAKTNIRPALVGFRVFTNDAKKEILEVTIYDYEPTAFLTSTYEMFKTGTDNPTMLTAPIRLQFVRK